MSDGVCTQICKHLVHPDPCQKNSENTVASFINQFIKQIALLITVIVCPLLGGDKENSNLIPPGVNNTRNNGCLGSHRTTFAVQRGTPAEGSLVSVFRHSFLVIWTLRFWVPGKVPR